MTSSNSEQRLGAKALDLIQGYAGSVNLCIDEQEKATAENTKAIDRRGTKIDKRANSISTQNRSLERLGHGIGKLVTGINSQQETFNDFMKA